MGWPRLTHPRPARMGLVQAGVAGAKWRNSAHEKNAERNDVRERAMKSVVMLGMTALAVVLVQGASCGARDDQAPAQTPPPSPDKSPPQAEGAMEGVVVTAHKDGSIVSVSVTTDAKGHYAFPENRLEPGHYTLAIRAVGYDLERAGRGRCRRREDDHGRPQARQDQESRRPAHQCRMDDEHPRHRGAEGVPAQLRRAATRWSASCARPTMSTNGRRSSRA